jgi:geranylgeranyl pyrophosphate synthase
MAAIGTLEGSEEGGIRDVLPPERMIDQVHRTRGGALFELAFVVPYRLLPAPDSNVLARAQRAISKMGTAFQIVDDLTDFEFDVTHGRHNLLVAQITHHGSARERSLLAGLNSKVPEHDVVITDFSDSARAVMARGEREIGEALEELESLGFWLSPHLGHQLLRAIVGLEGVARMHAL